MRKKWLDLIHLKLKTVDRLSGHPLLNYMVIFRNQIFQHYKRPISLLENIHGLSLQIISRMLSYHDLTC